MRLAGTRDHQPKSLEHAQRTVSDDGTKAYMAGWDYGFWTLDTSMLANASSGGSRRPRKLATRKGIKLEELEIAPQKHRHRAGRRP